MNSITLFGSTGKTGMELIQLALSKNFFVNAFCRTKKSFTFSHENLKIVEGNVLNPENVNNVISGSNIVINALGTKPPYTDIFCKESTIYFINAMKIKGVKRFICVTGAMIGGNKNNLSMFMKFLKNRFESKYPLIANDRTSQEEVIMQSGLDWTIIKPPRLSNGNLKECVAGEILKISGLSSVSRKSLAGYIIDILDDKSTFRKSLFVKN